MKTTKLFSRMMTLFLLMMLGFALGAKSAGIENSQFLIIMAIISVLSMVHFSVMRKKFSQY